MTQPDDIETAAVNLMLEAAEHVIVAGVTRARHDDPHRWATLPREFDDGLARRRLQVDYLGDGRVDVSLLLVGEQNGEERVAAVFTTVCAARASAGSLQ